MASVEPHVTTISVSGSRAGQPFRAYLAAMAPRSVGEPHVTGYWFTPDWMAATAAALITSAASKSGKPWARLMARWSSARRVISRITDSVNLAVLDAEAC